MPGPIGGSTNVCVGSTTILTNSVGGGTWASTSTGIATIGSSSGLATGISAGVTTIVYTLSAGCDAMINLTVDPLPAPITGPNQVCATQYIGLSDATPGGTWTSGATSIATVDAVTGVVGGVSAGSVLISYTAGCTATYPITVNPMPRPIGGNLNVCLGGTSTLTDSVTGGLWFSTNTLVATIGSSSGIVSGLSLGTTTIVYQLPGGCFVTALVHVYPLPTVFTVTGGGNHCAWDTGVHIGLSGSSVGVNYMLYRGSTAVGAFPGSGGPLDFGLLTVGGSYTVIGTSTLTGCSVTMAGSAAVGVIPTAVPAVTMNISPNDTVCAGTSVTYSVVPTNEGSAPAYEWRINSFPVSLATTYTFIPADGDIVSVQLTSNATCAHPITATHSQAMIVQPFAYPSVTISPAPNDTVCKGTLVTFDAHPVFGGPAPLYTWMVNGAPNAGGASFSFVPNDGDDVYCIMNSSYPCRLANADSCNKQTLTVEEPVYPVVTINATPGWLVSYGQNDTLTATVANPVNPTYQWFVNGMPVPAATNATYVTSNSSYPKEDSVSCMVTNHDICTMTGHQWVYIQVTTVGVSQVKAVNSEINILPNPNSGEFLVKGSLGSLSDEEVSFEITDMLGQVVYTNKAMAKNGKLNERIQLGGNIANGMYILTLRSDSETKVFHVVIEQ